MLKNGDKMQKMYKKLVRNGLAKRQKAVFKESIYEQIIIRHNNTQEDNR